MTDAVGRIEGKEIIPLNDRLVVLPIKENEVQKSGLIIPNRSKGDAYYARVVAIGTGFTKSDGTKHPLSYKIGDVVLYGRGAGTLINFNDVEHLILTDDDVLAIYRGKEYDV